MNRHFIAIILVAVGSLLLAGAAQTDPLDSLEEDFRTQMKHLSLIRKYRSKTASGHQKTPLSIEDPKEKRYDPIVFKAARRYGLSPALIKAVIHAESNFDRWAVSHAGAQGLMQLMPRTAAMLDVDDVFDPAQNILGGTSLLRAHIEEFGSLKKAIIAYNAGPDRVRKNQRIPSETQTYIRKVIRHYYRYKREGY